MTAQGAAVTRVSRDGRAARTCVFDGGLELETEGLGIFGNAEEVAQLRMGVESTPAD